MKNRRRRFSIKSRRGAEVPYLPEQQSSKNQPRRLQPHLASVVMKILGVCLMLCSLLELNRAHPTNYTNMPRGSKDHMGPCTYMTYKIRPGDYVPQCDDDGYFLPTQCCKETGYCWCVDVYTGRMEDNTKALVAEFHYQCGKDYYCPQYWTYSPYDHRCYMFVNSPKTWIEAEIYCLFEGGNLASVHSALCYHGIQELTKYDYDFPVTWLGGQDFAKNCVWLWTDGTKFNYDSWYMDTSYYYMDRQEHCLVMNYGLELKWHYANCSDSHPFVCVKNDWKKFV